MGQHQTADQPEGDAFNREHHTVAQDSPIMSRTCAPSATRTPNSRVRCATEYDDPIDPDGSEQQRQRRKHRDDEPLESLTPERARDGPLERLMEYGGMSASRSRRTSRTAGMIAVGAPD